MTFWLILNILLLERNRPSLWDIFVKKFPKKQKGIRFLSQMFECDKKISFNYIVFV